MVWKYRFGKEKYIKEINCIREWQNGGKGDVWNIHVKCL